MPSNPSFQSFINNKPLFYKEIDHKRVHLAYETVQSYIQKPLTIHVVGTNGKGSTGRIMAMLLHLQGKKVGHFSSPHILKFNERIWINGQDSDDKTLEEAHQELYAILGQSISDALSYFEYTTLLALVAMQELEIIILEAGLGGEFDATNVAPKALSVITPIGLDHQDFLGDTIEAIATTKLNSIEKKAVIGLQINKKICDIAQEITNKKGANLFTVQEFLANNLKESEAVLRITQEMGWSDYLYENTLLALFSLKILNLSYNINDLYKIKLFGRFYQLQKNIIIDVGHNLLAGEAIVKSLKKKYNRDEIILVYNTLEDKDFKGIVKLFAPFVKRIEIINIDTPRAIDAHSLKEEIEKNNLLYKVFESIEPDQKYVVFGSFYVVEAFLKKVDFV
ncbi:MAG TPA: bifunctional folylpolyglutamate synthase/dihydrofolate synthase [Campylobacterales bacterium]|nr:bifunctional folylpolyglutamate synthase/dihydrofolate synthase [Campylobacterales bacterium]HIP42106.1 bifunctional folylpolyglutamate synthase/dihydrofolate synthase [Campylobacterales bacterium]